MDRKAVKVKWLDPYSIDEWKPIKELDYKITHIESFGYEVHVDEKVTCFTLNWDEEQESVSCTMVVPNECIIEYEYLDVEE
jgi:hypothetical protein